MLLLVSDASTSCRRAGETHVHGGSDSIQVFEPPAYHTVAACLHRVLETGGEPARRHVQQERVPLERLQGWSRGLRENSDGSTRPVSTRTSMYLVMSRPPNLQIGYVGQERLHSLQGTSACSKAAHSASVHSPRSGPRSAPCTAGPGRSIRPDAALRLFSGCEKIRRPIWPPNFAS